MSEPLSVHTSSASAEAKPSQNLPGKTCSQCGAPRRYGVCESLFFQLFCLSTCPDPTFDYRAERAQKMPVPDLLIAQLLFASRDLARTQMLRSRNEDYCLLCGVKANIDSFIGHDPTCKIGRVANVIDRICAAGSAPASEPAKFEPTSLRKETAQPEPPACTEAGTPSCGETFAEPWKVDTLGHPSEQCVVNANDWVVAETLGPVERRRGLADRIAACVNFCGGIPTEMLQKQRPLADPTRDINEVVAVRKVLPKLPVGDRFQAVTR